MTDSSARRHSGADSSAGGAAATGGVDFDALVLAWMAAYMLANIALPQPWRLHPRPVDVYWWTDR